MPSDIVISTPLRLVSSIQSGHLSLHKYVQVHLLMSTSVFIRCYLGSVRHLILDETDRMLDQEFITQIQEILVACTHERLQTAVFSATLPSGAERIALDMLRDPIRVVVGLKCVHSWRW